MGVQGFPTLKIVKPSKQPGKKGTVEDYQGPRTAKGITDAVTDKIASYVMRLKSGGDFDKFVAKTPDRPKGLVFSEKGLVPAFVKTLAIDFLGGVDFGYVRSADKELVSKFGVTTFPAVLLLPNGDDSDPKPFTGDIGKASLVDFFSQVMPPHPDALPASSSSSSKPSSKSSAKSKKSTKPTPTAATESLDPDSYPQHPKESPDPDVSSDQPKPIQVPVGDHRKPAAAASSIQHLATADALQKACLHAKSSTCLIAVVPGASPDDKKGADDQDGADPSQNSLLAHLAAVAAKHASRGAKLFPIYRVDASNAEFQALADGLKLPGGPVVMAVNAKRGWFSLFEESESAAAVEGWIDGIRLGDFKKEKLPEGLVRELEETPGEVREEEVKVEEVRESVEHVDL